MSSSSDTTPVVQEAAGDEVPAPGLPGPPAVATDGAQADGATIVGAGTPQRSKRLELTVPKDAETVRQAIDDAKEKGVDDLLVNLEEDFAEPPDAFPLELVADDSLRCIEIRGPTDRNATLCEVALCAHAHLSVTLRSLAVRGPVTLGGEGCVVVDCELRCGAEISPEGGAVIRGCDIKSSRRMAIVVNGSALLENNVVEASGIGVCLYGNHAMTLRQNRFAHCGAAAVMVHYSLEAAEGASVDFVMEMDKDNEFDHCSQLFIMHVEVEGAPPLTLDEWPLPPGVYSLPMRRGGSVDVEVSVGKMLQVVGAAAPEWSPPRKKPRKKDRISQWATAAPMVDGLAWARETLGFSESVSIDALTPEAVRRMYRRRAREVHPDKGGVASSSGASFHRLTEAYEALSKAFPGVRLKASRGKRW